MVLAAQDEVATLPYFIPMQDLDVKIGGNEFDRLRRWHKQGKLSKSRGIPRSRFPATSSPRKIAALIRQGILQNARFAASVLVRGIKHSPKDDQHLLIRTDASFPTLYQIRRQGRFTTPVAYATAHVAAQFIKFFPLNPPAFSPGDASQRDAASHPGRHPQKRHQAAQKITLLKSKDDDELSDELLVHLVEICGLQWGLNCGDPKN